MTAGIPILRLSLESMEHSIVHAFTEAELQIDEDIKAAVEAFCTPENLKQVIHGQVQQTLDKVVREEVETYYRYGRGRQAVRKVLHEILDAAEANEAGA